MNNTSTSNQQANQKAKASIILGLVCLLMLCVGAALFSGSSFFIITSVGVALLGGAAFVVGIMSLLEMRNKRQQGIQEKGAWMAVVGLIIGVIFMCMGVANLTLVFLGPTIQSGFENIK